MNSQTPQGWKLKSIGELSTVRRGASPRPIKDSKWWGGSVGWVRISDVTSSRKYLKKTTQYLSVEGVEKSVKIDKGEVVLTICATIGRAIIISVDACIHDGFVWFDKLGKSIDREYWYYFLASKEDFFKSQRQSGTQGNLNTNIVSDVLCMLPPLPEQQKIADILTSVDEVIEKTQAQIDKLKDLKTAMMQELLTKGIGHVEFKDSPVGRIPVGWEVDLVGNLFEMKLGKMLSKESKVGDSPYPYLGNKNVQWGKVDMTELQCMDFTPNERQKFSLKRGDLLVCEGGDVGRTAIWEDEMKDCYYQKAIHRLRSIKDCYHPHFFLEYIKYAKESNLLTDFISQTSIAHLTKEKLSLIPLPFPPMKEQIEIVKICVGMNKKINFINLKNRKLINVKKALMQDLLTGKVRVKTEQTNTALAVS
jgi:type I restriction enzyme S subunit